MKVAIDIGGTFTDVLAVGAGGALTSLKLPSRRGDVSDSFGAALAAATGSPEKVPEEILYSATLALNALLTHRLPRIGLIVNSGFRELLETARLPSGDDEAFRAQRTLAGRLVPLECVGEVQARLEADGSERRPVDAREVAALARRYRDEDFEIVAVSLLHSYLDARHEREIAAIFAREAPRIDVVLSSEVLPELREYERTLATCLNACLMPPMRSHLARLAGGPEPTPLLVMKSSGGLASARASLRKPLTTALSGPGAAVVGMRWLGDAIGVDHLITLDVGGTSTDVALVRDGAYATTTDGEIAGFPFPAPMIDVFTVGAGGGSIAVQGADARWRVGPDSAGADPGPVCYARGGQRPTLTDAQLVLGRLPDALLGGDLPLDPDAARAALGAFGAARGLDATQAARGILGIATHNMCGAIRRVSVLRGHDPKDYALFAIGGAGPLHGAELARLLGMGSVVVPPQPGLAAAYGLLVANVEDDFVHAYGEPEATVDIARMGAAFEALEESGQHFLSDEGIPEDARHLRRALDVRYAGMSRETTVELAGGPVTRASVGTAIEAFHHVFERAAGHSHRGQEAVEIVNLRLTARGARPRPALLTALGPAAREPEPRARRAVAFLDHDGFVDSAVYERAALGAGARLRGPAGIEQYESTCLVPPDFDASVDGTGNVMLTPRSTSGPGAKAR